MAAPTVLIRRDIAVISMVDAFGGCTVVQVASRLFPNVRGPRVCYRRVAGLIDHGFLASRRLPAASGVGSGKIFLTLTPKGRSVAAAAQGLSVKNLPRRRASSPRFIEHHLAIGDTRIGFELASERSFQFKVSGWRPDRDTIIEVPGASGRSTVIVPDGAFELNALGGEQIHGLLEQDTGSLTNRNRMRARLEGYLSYTQNAPALVLFVTTTMERLAALVDLAFEIGNAVALSPRAVWFTTATAVATGDALHGRIWRVPGNKTLVAVADVFANVQGPAGANGGPVA